MDLDLAHMLILVALSLGVGLALMLVGVCFMDSSDWAPLPFMLGKALFYVAAIIFVASVVVAFGQVLGINVDVTRG